MPTMLAQNPELPGAELRRRTNCEGNLYLFRGIYDLFWNYVNGWKDWYVYSYITYVTTVKK